MKFYRKDNDENGAKILNVLSTANRFNKWMYKSISPFCMGNILEIGSGLGNISRYFIKDNKSISLSDIREDYNDFVKEKFKNFDNEKVFNIDIAEKDFTNKYAKLINRFDSVLCLNVLEHINDDNLAIKNMLSLLCHNGSLIILVLAYQILYNKIDETLKHYLRYDRVKLKELVIKHGIITNFFYFNAIGVFAWFIGGKLLKNKTIPQGEMKLFNYLVPICKLIDLITFNKIGLSLVCVIKKRPI